MSKRKGEGEAGNGQKKRKIVKGDEGTGANMVGSFAILRVPVLPSSSFHRFLYVTEHKGARDGAEAGSVLFVANIPPTSTATSIKSLFPESISVSLNTLRSGHVHSAHVTFKDKKAAGRVLEWIKDTRGSRLVSRDTLREEADNCIADYEAMEETERSREREREAQEAADGWTLVTRKGKRDKIREAKRDQLALLRERFEKDKERVNKLKAARRFNPF
ncbi:unnamed protein product [Sphagnum tenellum]